MSKSIPPASFTVYEYADRYGLARETARREVGLMVKAGRLKMAADIRNGRRVNVFWVAEGSAE